MRLYLFKATPIASFIAVLALLLALVVFPVVAKSAEMVLVVDDLTVTLYDTPCDNEDILAMLKPETREFYQGGFVTAPPVELNLCWRVSPDGYFVWIIDAQGATPPGIPLEMFKPKTFI